MESACRSSGDEEELGRGRRSCSPGVELSAKVDGKSGEKAAMPTSPRSKHSAMEQRRRCKINDRNGLYYRFQILRDLIPHSDQKRDRASFLMEVIEYIKFLQEKEQKHELYSGWNQENAKLVPWSNTDGICDPKNGPAQPGFLFSEKFIDNNIPVVPLNATNAAETDTNADPDNFLSQPQSGWQRSSCPADCTMSSDMLSEQGELVIDEGTINISTVYSQGFLTTITQALQSSGVDLSQASISVQINLGRRANRRSVATTTMSSAKDNCNHSPLDQVMGDSVVGSNGDESEQAPKRQKIDDH
ncbi:transcription factor BIM2-like isoform X3 [Musa acuminata AAA Group]|uniref:transcription factor BIM2-like isoform X3 n=1 Tax=Musa acuminata AAA Group TaxID=214697 RepID=UPI0031DBE7F7